jgi:ubiquinone/menaquinone biosynthesis C-methylase UbiE
MIPWQNKFDYLNHYKTDAKEFDYFEERIEPAKHEERRVREVILSNVPKHCNFILDVGCGSGWLAKNLIPKNIKVISLDISTDNPLKVNSLIKSENHFPVVADSFKLPFKNETFHCVVASEVIEHTHNPEEFIRELFRTVTKGGKLIISSPYKEKIIYHLCVHCNKKTPANAHLHSFSESVFEKLYTGKDLNRFKYIIFGNKALIFLRTHIILKYLPLKIWLAVDWIANRIFNKPLHIVCTYEKKD